MDVFFPNTNFKVREQYYTYEWADWYSDFGGYMGLLLGASMLTFYDLAQQIYKRACGGKKN